MRKNKLSLQQTEFSILTVDDDEIMTITLKSYFEALNFKVDIENDPVKAIERVKNGEYDILLLDFLMRPICGDEVVRQIREFNREIFIVLLTGHKSMAPPIKTVRDLDIQGYFEKSDRFDQLELLIESCVKSIRQMKTIKKYRNGLQDILDFTSKLYFNDDMDDVLKSLLDEIMQIMNTKSGYLFIDCPDIGEYHIKTGEYEELNADAGRKAMVTEFVSNKRTVIRGENMITPVFADDGDIFGVLLLKTANLPTPDDIRLFEVFAKQAATVINNLMYRYTLDHKNDELEEAYSELKRNLMETVNAMRLIVDARDIYTRGHSDRVAHYSVLTAKKLGRDAGFIERLRIAGLFHDIGKVGIPDSILLKDTKLTDEEYGVIKTHPVLGRKILSSITNFKEILDIIELHHVHYDGGGYPQGRKGKELPEETRIISIADSFDAMTSKRTYRNGLSLDDAVSELKRCKGTQFDPELVDIFIDIINEHENIYKDIEWTFNDNKLEGCVEANEKIPTKTR